MKYLMTFHERRADPDPAAARRRLARSLGERALPAGTKVHDVVARIGGGGGCAVVEAADAEGLQQVAALFSAFACSIEPVMDVVPEAPSRRAVGAAPAAPAGRNALPEMPASEPHEGAFSDDDVYDTED